MQQEEDAGELSELSQAQHVITVPDFAPELCQQLRQVRPGGTASAVGRATQCFILLLMMHKRTIQRRATQATRCAPLDVCMPSVQVFDDRFQDPRHTSEDRFLWDYFHIPNQYTMHRTQVGATCATDPWWLTAAGPSLTGHT